MNFLCLFYFIPPRAGSGGGRIRFRRPGQDPGALRLVRSDNWIRASRPHPLTSPPCTLGGLNSGISSYRWTTVTLLSLWTTLQAIAFDMNLNVYCSSIFSLVSHPISNLSMLESSGASKPIIDTSSASALFSETMLKRKTSTKSIYLRQW